MPIAWAPTSVDPKGEGGPWLKRGMPPPFCAVSLSKGKKTVGDRELSEHMHLLYEKGEKNDQTNAIQDFSHSFW